MLQRAASNAYSWWWASHIRTNQSKWLDNNLQDMEKRVKSMLKIIEEDADSFAKRAEMYYKRRPELISFVEETYRAYRALAERYDRISGELHKANHTLATAFPDVQFPMQDEDDENSPKAVASIDSTKIPKPLTEYPQIRVRNKNSENKQASKVSQPRRIASQISEEEAKEAIDRLQKHILVLQTEKEFIKSSCDSGMTKYWEIEKQITEMQDQVCFLQDEFSASAVIEDDEARALMAMTALRSCKDTLVNLQELQKRSVEETRIESERIKVAKEKLRALKGEYCQPDKEIGEISDGNTVMSAPTRNTGEDACDLHPESLELQMICEKVKDHFEISSNTSVVELAEKIDELVNKVISLELTVSSQTAQIKRLRSETDELQKHLRGLEEERVSSADDSNGLSGRLKQAENELHKIQSLEKRVQYGKAMLHTDLTEACLSLNDVSEKLQSPKHQDQVKIATPSQEEERSLLNIEPQNDSEEEEVVKVQDTRDNVEEETREFQEQHGPPVEQDQVQSDPGTRLENDSEKFQSPSQEDKIRGEEDSLRANDSDRVVSSEPETQVGEQEDSPNLQKVLLSGLEGREKVLLAEYTSILRNYKETKKKLLDVEKKNQEYFSETMTQVRELKSANAVKDDEIRSLRQILRSLQTCSSFVGTLESPLTPLNSEVMPEDVAKGDTPLRVQDRGGLYADDDIKPYRIIDETQATPSPIEEKFRRDIDTLLDENLEFWLRFSTSFHQIQRFRTEFQGLQADAEKLKDGKAEGCNSAGSDHGGNPARSAPVEKQLRELKTELQVWLEQNVLLRGELQSRFSSLCNIKEEISGALKKEAGSEGGQFTPCQAAKFQGEVLNMQQENNKVADELQAGLDHVRGLQVEVDRILSKIHDKFELSSSKSGHHHYHHHFRHFSSKSRGIPLRSFLYGVKPKKPSIFSCMNPALQKQYSDLRGLPI